MDEKECTLPLVLFKQAMMKLDSFMTDIYEIREDENLNDEDRLVLETISDMAGGIEAALMNTVSKEIDEEVFLNENIKMDHIDPYPGDEDDILDQDI